MLPYTTDVSEPSGILRKDRRADLFGDNTAVGGHAQKSLQGGFIFVAARVVNAGVQIGSVILLARMLSPEDYGVATMVAAVTGFAPMMVDLGTRDAIVQRTRITEGEVSALFWITMGVGCLLGLAVAASGPILSSFYREPRLVPIALVSSMTVLSSAAVCQHQGLMRRAMMFRELSLVEISANVLSGLVALTMAFLGQGYWALVVRPIVAAILTAVGVWVLCGWIPGTPVFTEGVRAMLKFGIHLSSFSVVDSLGRSIDSIAIGRLFGAERLGYYRKSLLIYENSLDLVTVLHGVATVSLSKLRDQPNELKRLWSRGLSTVCFYAMPVFGAIAVTSQDLIVLLFREKWATAGVLLSVLALRGIPHVVERTLGWLHVASGRSDRWMRWGIFSLGMQLVALLCGLPFGPMGIATAYVVVMFALFVPAIVYAGRPLGIGARDVIQAVWAPLTGSLVAVVLGFLIRFAVLTEVDRLPRLLTVAALYTVTYAVLVPGIFGLRKPLTVFNSFLPRRLQTA